METKEPEKRQYRTNSIRFIFTWVFSTAVIISILLTTAQNELLEISVAGLSIVLSAVLLKYLDVYERWMTCKEDIRHIVDEIEILSVKLDIVNMDNGGRV